MEDGQTISATSWNMQQQGWAMLENVLRSLKVTKDKLIGKIQCHQPITTGISFNHEKTANSFHPPLTYSLF
jgi:hypothetical protein